MDWLWPLTAAPQRAFRANAMWLHKHLAALLQSGSGAGKPPCHLLSAAYHRCLLSNVQDTFGRCG